MIELRDITRENFWDVVSLTVSEEQEDLVTSNAVSIAQARIQPECIPLAVYADDIPVGFVMYCIDADDDEYWIYRLMIDEKHQGNGYGKEALNHLLDRIKADKTHTKILLGVQPEGGASVHLYKEAGFRYTGAVFGKEHIMCLEYGE